MNELSKSQTVRLVDIFAFGPAMIYIGTSVSMKAWMKWFLIGGGIATILYNGRNYLRNVHNG